MNKTSSIHSTPRQFTFSPFCHRFVLRAQGTISKVKNLFAIISKAGIGKWIFDTSSLWKRQWRIGKYDKIHAAKNPTFS